MIFNPFLTYNYVANKCKIYVTVCCKTLQQHSRANKQGNLGRYFTIKFVIQNLSYAVYNMQPTVCRKK